MKQLFCFRDTNIEKCNVLFSLIDALKVDTDPIKNFELMAKIENSLTILKHLERIYKLLIDQRVNCEYILDDTFHRFLEVNKYVYHNDVMELYYKTKNLDYKPKIEEFTYYFLWNKFRTIISNNESEYNMGYQITLFQEFKYKYKLSLCTSQVIPNLVLSETYNNIMENNKLYETLRKILCEKTNEKWFKFEINYKYLIDWYDCDHFIIENDYYLLCPSYLYFNVITQNITIKNNKSLICFCDESYDKYKENTLRIVNEVILMNNDFEYNIELKEKEMNRKVMNIQFETKVYCYVTKYLYVSERLEYIKFAVRFAQYNIFISSEKIEKFVPKDEWIRDLTPECNRHIIQKAFEEQNYILAMNSVKYIESYGTKCLLINTFVFRNECNDNEYIIKLDDQIGCKLTLLTINDL
jgi:hypothetical protein